MKISFSTILLIFECICVFASALFSLVLIRNRKAPIYIKKFYWYPVTAAVGFLLQLLQIHFPFVKTITNGLPTVMVLLFHFSFLSYFIYNVLDNWKNGLKSMGSIFLLLVSAALFCLLADNLKHPKLAAYTCTTLGLVIFCCFYYSRIFENAPKQDLLKSPSFWIINGIFFCMSGTILVLVLGYYLISPEKAFYMVIELIIAFYIALMYLFFNKSCLCVESLNCKQTQNNLRTAKKTKFN